MQSGEDTLQLFGRRIGEGAVREARSFDCCGEGGGRSDDDVVARIPEGTGEGNQGAEVPGPRRRRHQDPYLAQCRCSFRPRYHHREATRRADEAVARVDTGRGTVSLISTSQGDG